LDCLQEAVCLLSTWKTNSKKEEVHAKLLVVRSASVSERGRSITVFPVLDWGQEEVLFSGMEKNQWRNKKEKGGSDTKQVQKE
jgi:hypothetical protein